MQAGLCRARAEKRLWGRRSRRRGGGGGRGGDDDDDDPKGTTTTTRRRRWRTRRRGRRRRGRGAAAGLSLRRPRARRARLGPHDFLGRRAVPRDIPGARTAARARSGRRHLVLRGAPVGRHRVPEVGGPRCRRSRRRSRCRFFFLFRSLQLLRCRRPPREASKGSKGSSIWTLRALGLPGGAGAGRGCGNDDGGGDEGEEERKRRDVKVLKKRKKKSFVYNAEVLPLSLFLSLSMLGSEKKEQVFWFYISHSGKSDKGSRKKREKAACKKEKEG